MVSFVWFSYKKYTTKKEWGERMDPLRIQNLKTYLELPCATDGYVKNASKNPLDISTGPTR